MLAALCCLTLVRAQGTQDVRHTQQTQEMLDYFQGLAQLNFEWSPQDSPLAPIYSQLKEFSGVDYRIIPGQAVEWGQAHSNGIIMLNISALQKPKPILAYRLAHEWGHEALGHQSNLYPATGEIWEFRLPPLPEEDQADIYAGGFLAEYDYSLEQIIPYLGTLPDHFRQRDAFTRAEILSTAYSQHWVKRSLARYLEEKRNHDQEKCTHPLHPDGHTVVCEHRLHSGSHRRKCRHTCFRGTLGYRNLRFPTKLCHPEGDQVPCDHLVHEDGDVLPCIHPAHPQGHQATGKIQ